MSTPDSGASQPPDRPRVLLVDDNDAANKGLAKILLAWGFEVSVALDGHSALEMLQSGPPPDFLLTDLRLPDLDGREVARYARLSTPPPKVALITGWDLEDNLKDQAYWGIDWVFPKPLNVHDLISKLRESWSQRPRGATDDETLPRETPGDGPGPA